MSLDLFTAEGYPWTRFFLAKRVRSLPRQGSMQTCGCGRTFVRTEVDPCALQVCQVCDHDRREYPETERRPVDTHVVSITRRKRSRTA